MNEALVSLAAASIAFVGLHFALSHPLRRPLVGTLGERGFMALYSVVALGTFIWMVRAFKAAPMNRACGMDLPIPRGSWRAF